MRKFVEFIGWLWIINTLWDRFRIDEFIDHKVDDVKEAKPQSRKDSIKMGFQLNR